MSTPPLVMPIDLDLRDFPFMPLDVLRLRDSDLTTLSNGDEFKAAVLLWCAAWHQVPAGSVPDDDRWLARHSGAQSPATWRKVKAGALRGFSKGSDGRLYHPVVCEKALTAWAGKQEQRIRTLKARIAATEKRLASADSDEERRHIQTLLQSLRQTLPQDEQPAPRERDRDKERDRDTETESEGRGKTENQCRTASGELALVVRKAA